MSRLTEIIAKIKTKDAQLGLDLEKAFRALSAKREFGLNFEGHRTEIVELDKFPFRKGEKVRILPTIAHKAFKRKNIIKRRYNTILSILINR